MENYRCVTSVQEIQKYIGNAAIVAFDYETAPDEPYRTEEKAALDPHKSHIVGCSFSVKEHTGIYIPVAHKIGENIDNMSFYCFLKSFLTNKNIFKIAHNITFESAVSSHHDIVIQPPVYDTICAAQMTLKSNYEFRKLADSGLKRLASELCQEPLPTFSDVTNGRHFDELDAQDSETVRYGCADSDFALRLYHIFNNWFDRFLPKSIFAARIVCGDCGNFYGSKVWHSTSKYRRVIWRCNHKFNGMCKCNTPHLYEDNIKAKFLDACNRLFENRDEILENCRMMQDILTDCSEIEEKQKLILQEMEIVAELTRKYIMENSQTAQNQDEYNSHYNVFVERYEKLKKKSLVLQKQQEERLAKRDLIGGFILELTKCRELLAEFDEKLWVALVECVTVFQDGRLAFEFRNGTKIEV